jgi:hypothetical protein
LPLKQTRAGFSAFGRRPPAKYVVIMTRDPHKRLEGAWKGALYASTPLQALAACPTRSLSWAGRALSVLCVRDLRVCAGRLRDQIAWWVS